MVISAVIHNPQPLCSRAIKAECAELTKPSGLSDNPHIGMHENGQDLVVLFLIALLAASPLHLLVCPVGYVGRTGAT